MAARDPAPTSRRILIAGGRGNAAVKLYRAKRRAAIKANPRDFRRNKIQSEGARKKVVSNQSAIKENAELNEIIFKC